MQALFDTRATTDQVRRGPLQVLFVKLEANRKWGTGTAILASIQQIAELLELKLL